jgi:hypothetical protein
MAKLETNTQRFALSDFKNGIVREAAVDELLVPKDSVELAINMHFDRIGAVVRRPGLTKLGETISSGNPVLGMGFYRNNAGTTFAALAKVNTDVYANTGSGWSSVRPSLTAGLKARFTNFVDYTFMVDGNATVSGSSVLKTWNGSGSFGTTNAASLPKGDFIENYRSRIWVGDKATDKLYYSDVVTTSNTITGGTSFLQISPADGESMTGLKRHPRALLVFKQNHIYRVFSVNSTDPDPSINRGTYSQESIVEAKDGIYYHHPTGFYKFVFDGEQEEISRPIIDVLQAIPRSQYENIAGWADDDHVSWEIGDITLDGISFTNLVCRRTISTQVWTIYSYPMEFRSSTLYDSGSGLFNLLGGSDGSAYKYDVGTDDAGTSIFYDLITHWLYLTDDKRIKKTLTKIAALAENATGANISYQIDMDHQEKSNNAWREIGGIKKNISETLSLNAKNFTRIRFRFSGSGKGTAPLFRGFEGLDTTTANDE